MEQNQIDKGLKKAMKTKETPRLSSNFTFRTMLKVQEVIRLKEQKHEKQMFWAIVVASVILLVGGGVTVGYFWGAEFLGMFSNLFMSIVRMDLFSSPYGYLSLAILLLLGLDYWMRWTYFKRHRKD